MRTGGVSVVVVVVVMGGVVVCQVRCIVVRLVGGRSLLAL